MSISSTSEFFNYYKRLDSEINEIGIPGKTSHQKVYDLIRKNFQTIASFKDKTKEGFLTFSSSGEITIDKWSGYHLRSAIKHHIIQYSGYSQDMKRDLAEFTQFVKDYLQTHINQVEEQKLLILKKMLTETIAGMENVQKFYHKNGLIEEANSLDQSIKKLTKSLNLMNEKIQKKKQTPLEQMSVYIDALNGNEQISKKNKVALLKNKLDALRNPGIALNTRKFEESRNLLLKVDEEKKLIEKKIEELLKGPNANEPAVKAEVDQLKKEIEEKLSSEEYQKAEEMTFAYKSLMNEQLSQYHSVLKSEQYRPYFDFIQSLTSYKNEEDQRYLLANLMLNAPKPQKLEKLQKRLMEIKSSEKKLSTEIKTLERIALKESGLFDEAIEVIKERKQAKKAALASAAPKESKKWILGKAAANFFAAGGILTLAVMVPQAALVLGYVPSLLKTSYQGIRRAWDEKTEVEQNQIKKDLERFFDAVKQNPVQAIDMVKNEYANKGNEGQKMIQVVNELVNLSKDPAGFEALEKFIKG